MTLAELSLLPAWPKVMDVATATLYVGGSPTILEFLESKQYLQPLTARHRLKTYLRDNIDAALLMAEANADDFRLETPKRKPKHSNAVVGALNGAD